MLTVDFERLGLQPGDRVLDLGCGAGRHAFAVVERGGIVTAVDADDTEVKGVAGMFDMLDAEGRGDALVGDALALPFPDGTFDRVIAAEVLEHIPADTAAIAELVRVLRPGGTIAVTVPRWGPELLNWALSDDYHNTPGGHVRIYRRSALAGRLQAAGLRLTGRHHAHALHSPYWWLKCAVGVRNDQHPIVRAYHRLLVWDITSAPPVTRIADRLLNPVLGKSVVLYGVKPG
jgi:SAM-dependent methyltransferase